jgi:hypothetical protein
LASVIIPHRLSDRHLRISRYRSQAAIFEARYVQPSSLFTPHASRSQIVPLPMPARQRALSFM